MAAGFLATVLVFGLTGAAGADSFTLTVAAQTNSTITFSYPAQTGYGYMFSANGAVVSRTYNAAQTQVRFSKANSYEVAAIVKGATGSYPTAPPAPQCSDNADNDGDGKVDLADPGCSSATDNDETDPTPPRPACSDTVDNDGDGKIDYPADPGCTSAADTDETDTVIPPPTTISAAQCASRAAVNGAVIDNVTVTGGCSISGANVTINHSVVQGVVALNDGSHLTNSTATGFSAFGASDWTVDNNTLDGQGRVDQNIWWDAPAGNAPDNWVVRNNTIRNFYDAANPGNHSEGLYVGYSTNGLIEGNTFTNNGNTGHIFFTWFGSTANPSTSYPRNVCVRGNTFNQTHGAYVDINFRSEIPTSSNIKIQSNATTTSPQFYGTC